MSELEFTTPSDALAKIPPGTEFLVTRYSGGRPRDVSNPDTSRKSWTPLEFDTALRLGLIDTKSKYHLVPLISGKKSSQKITLNLAVENESVTINQPGGVAVLDPTEGPVQMPPTISQSPHLQEIVVDGLLSRMTEDRQDLKDKDIQIWKLLEENHDLKMKVAKLELEKEFSDKIAESSDGGNRFIGELVKSPALPALLQMLGAPKLLQEAAKSHQSQG